MARSRKARESDIDEVALALPRTTKVPGWAGLPSYQVSRKFFVGYRSPRPDALDAATGERLTDVLVFRVPDEGDKLAFVQGDGPWFTTDHFNGYNAVLLRLAHLGQLTRDELAEVIEDAWRSQAPKTVVRRWEDECPS
ncbi:MmcQ/YjbR family DNA-binding protein [Mumia sp. ZJ430]|uniref:MmcQ/YjbR family DNA-binding protein n=1 Tax=Mumia sp. ZJ430 TaxID=2708083 RepID=UPI00142111FF|nr:MmcQ/YjbR family DNA-binding protein [Mumia sp. ZJ430]